MAVSNWSQRRRKKKRKGKIKNKERKIIKKLKETKGKFKNPTKRISILRINFFCSYQICSFVQKLLPGVE